MRLCMPQPAGSIGHSDPEIQGAAVGLSDVHAVQSAVTEVLHAIDMRRWTTLPSLFTTDVTTDYTSLFGGEVQRQHRQQLIDGWRQMLSPLDATQHLLGPIVVTGDAARAVADCHVRGYHIWDQAPGGREWMVAGPLCVRAADDRREVARVEADHTHAVSERQSRPAASSRPIVRSLASRTRRHRRPESHLQNLQRCSGEARQR